MLQKSKSASPSPVKWKHKEKQEEISNSTVRTIKRVQLFPDKKTQEKYFTNFAEEFPQLQAEPVPAKYASHGMGSNKLKNDENASNRRFKRSTKICLSDFLLTDSKNSWSNNSTNNMQPFSSTKLVNKKRGRKTSPEVKSIKEKPLHFLDNRHNVIPCSTQLQNAQM